MSVKSYLIQRLVTSAMRSPNDNLLSREFLSAMPKAGGYAIGAIRSVERDLKKVV
ncbi:hypothetical protein [Nostoc sp.]|uniref:hypothetical protein n=1 Tax=Nostoc sp. TaxID=1180 RepID=UPI002FFCD076